MLEINSQIPNFSLESYCGKTISDNDLVGKFAVIVFYPKNSTPG